MKTKAIILIAIAAVVSLSFAFTTKKDVNTKKESAKTSANSKEVALSGFLLEDKM